jgi:hypothetical protein
MVQLQKFAPDGALTQKTGNSSRVLPVKQGSAAPAVRKAGRGAKSCL